MLIFISGGVRSGKSALGEKLAAALAKERRKIYLATARDEDKEMAERICLHRRQRADKGFISVDRSVNITGDIPFFQPEDTVLLDCLGILLANELFCADRNPRQPAVVGKRILKEIISLNRRVSNLIIVSNELFSDGIEYDRPVEDYIRTLARLHREIVLHGDIAIECVYTGYQCHKGKTRLEACWSGPNPLN
ncbi:cobalbumin biosynthesis protein [Syntrophobotulus glycolicus DSM 8271]|uniref:Adenosylcobinamide kinase n=1 Tax=Syntrophobotulus glycolicus (strain DSM 8271 / FlGlyR) TaxID=645991 RepID=F0SZ53_SYNGF|nr:bifunctional adenosylcobinamide kinase/adenosylcobinamide-phosphate guanylyltransferase [Syntrophobotulus glycolicus]ADY57171.1 cobalbumin biosynthesis protein [Syntrophobotulus glycolicus DSM 8271]